MVRLALVLVLAAAGCADRPRSPAPAPAAPGPFGTAAPQSVRPGLTGGALVAALRADYTPERTLGYDRARDLLFAYEMRTAGHLRDPYTGFELALPPGDPSTAAFENGINTEHTWPQSKGARDEPLRSDLHHLYPVRDNVNSSRGNLPFGDVPDDRAEAWYSLDVSQSKPPATHRERWSERGRSHWEPRDDDKGNVARAVFYVYTVYEPLVDDDGGAAFFAEMRPTLLAWNRLDPPDAAEANRSAWIATQQGTPNPFVLDPGLADRAYGAGVPSPPRGAPSPGSLPQTPRGAPAPGAPAQNADLWVAQIHYDNRGEDVGEGVGVAGLPGARLDGWSLALYTGERVYRTVALTGSLGGDGTRFVAVEALQNGPADGVALVGPTGRVAEFLSYEGTITAAEGPAAGRRSVDVGVAETGREAPGTLLLRSSRTGAWRLGPR